MSEQLRRYLALNDAVDAIRSANFKGDLPDYEAVEGDILSLMDDEWYAMTDEERASLVENPPPEPEAAP